MNRVLWSMWSDNVYENLNKYLTELNGQCGLHNITKINLRMYPYTVRVPSHESKPGLLFCILFHNSQLVFSMARKERTG